MGEKEAIRRSPTALTSPAEICSFSCWGPLQPSSMLTTAIQATQRLHFWVFPGVRTATDDPADTLTSTHSWGSFPTKTSPSTGQISMQGYKKHEKSKQHDTTKGIQLFSSNWQEIDLSIAWQRFQNNCFKEC